MPALPYARKLQTIMEGIAPVLKVAIDPAIVALAADPETIDLRLGDPHEMPLPGLVAAIQAATVPERVDWFAYQTSEPEARTVVAASLRATRGLPFEEEDIFMTTGAFGALAVLLNLLCDPGDEVIYISPPWFFYEAMIQNAGGAPVPVPMRPDDFDLDLDAIGAALSPRTRAIIINSPHNPTGRIYPPETLRGLADLLTSASERHGRPIAILSDEAYSRIVFDGRPYHSPTAFYPHTFLLYTYGKTLLAPSERLGYIALPPTMPGREDLRLVILGVQAVHGYMFPSRILQRAIADIEPLSIDVAALQRRRDRVVGALHDMGYDVHRPEGTFYVMPRAPIADDMAFFHRLAEQKLLVLPGQAFQMPGYFRICLTATDEMLGRAFPILADAV